MFSILSNVPTTQCYLDGIIGLTESSWQVPNLLNRIESVELNAALDKLSCHVWVTFYGKKDYFLILSM